MATPFKNLPSDSSDAVNVIVEVDAKGSVPRPIDPNDPDLPRLLDLKRRLAEAKKKKKRRPESGSA